MLKKVLSMMIVLALILATAACATTAPTISSTASATTPSSVSVSSAAPSTASAATSTAPTGLGNIKVDGGLVSGVLQDDGVTSFKGIPYAAPPVGDLRWKDPQPVKAWEGVKKCDTFATIPVQSTTAWGFYQKEFYSDPYPKMSEDCLYLNVYTPAKAANEKLPVMVWIHGGGFGSGWSYEKEFNSDNLAKKGVILVTIEYRTSIFGFMAHPELTAESANKTSGNYGLLDQIAALKWVKNNIAGFGGDADNVTIFGQSAGAMSVDNLSCSPITKGLFKKAMMLSGAGYKSVMTLSDAEKIGSEFATSMNAKSIADLRKIPAEDLFKSVQTFQPKSVKLNGYLYLMPVADGYVLPTDINTATYQDIPYVAGYTTDDLQGIAQITPAFLDNLYQKGIKNLYTYEFARKMPGDDQGAYHSAECWYIFQTYDQCWRPLTDEDKTLADQMATYWANFAKTGDPNGNGVSGWDKYTPDKKFKMIFKTASENYPAVSTTPPPSPSPSTAASTSK